MGVASLPLPCPGPVQVAHGADRRRPSAWRRMLAASVVALLVLAGQAGGAAAQTSASTPVTVPATNRVATTAPSGSQSVTPDIIPLPNSGRAPRDAGERGGWMQEALFFLICAAVAGLGGLAWRDSRRKRRRQGRLGAAAGR